MKSFSHSGSGFDYFMGFVLFLMGAILLINISLVASGQISLAEFMGFRRVHIIDGQSR